MSIKTYTKISFALSIIFFLMLNIQLGYSQEPEPPAIPEPSPEPKPIKIPEPEPIRDPFPEESDSEKIQRLTEENLKLQKENFKLQIEIVELNKMIEKLRAITMEQIKVIMNLVNQLNEVIFEKSVYYGNNL